jgi:hypothetical protein
VTAVSVVLVGRAMVGSGAVLHTTPFVIMAEPPLLLIPPPLTAALPVTDVIGLVTNSGTELVVDVRVVTLTSLV